MPFVSRLSNLADISPPPPPPPPEPLNSGNWRKIICANVSEIGRINCVFDDI